MLNRYVDNKIRLLIVDDEMQIREMLKRHFEFKDFEVLTAENGMRALEVMQETYCAVVISDIKMPEMDGIELLREIRSQFPMAKMIMITGYITLDNIFTCMRLGAETVVYKPLEEIAELDNAVDRSIENIIRWQKKLSQLLTIKK